ncbi:hypothetical protein SAMN05421548_11722 [Paraburkholderia lycopersici]|uniref:Uncharacterized protein n=1 Tax=Paraburkholderia lycopersici TaxID=416944 RepID=A0A1G6TF69_9BURK|nr:hypothetical protein SAMN05421548_11722 [Paraburkholderia lycopersici]
MNGFRGPLESSDGLYPLLHFAAVPFDFSPMGEIPCVPTFCY